MSSARRGSHLLTLCLASVTIATWTPCSFDAWVLSLQNCSQSCYGEAFYDTTYNTTACGDYDTVTNSTKQSEVKCLCDNEYYGGAAWNLTSCWATKCGKSFNETRYADSLVVYSKMCLWADGKGTCNSTTSTATSLVWQPFTFLTAFGMAVSALAY